jgi:hypothetical protein
MQRQCQGNDGRGATRDRVDRRVASAAAARGPICSGVHVCVARRDADRRGFARIARTHAARGVARGASNSACVQKSLAFAPAGE